MPADCIKPDGALHCLMMLDVVLEPKPIKQVFSIHGACETLDGRDF